MNSQLIIALTQAGPEIILQHSEEGCCPGHTYSAPQLLIPGQPSFSSNTLSPLASAVESAMLEQDPRQNPVSVAHLKNIVGVSLCLWSWQVHPQGVYLLVYLIWIWQLVFEQDHSTWNVVVGLKTVVGIQRRLLMIFPWQALLV